MSFNFLAVDVIDPNMFLENNHWIPSIFDTKKKQFITEINGLPKNCKTKSLYNSLGQIFNSLIPSFEQTIDNATKYQSGRTKFKLNGLVEVCFSHGRRCVQF